MSKSSMLRSHLLSNKYTGKPSPPDYTIRWILLISLFVLSFRVVDWASHRTNIKDVENILSKNGVEQAHQIAWSQLATSLKQSRPTVRDVKKWYSLPAVSIDAMEAFDNQEAMDIHANDIKALQRSHYQFVDDIRESKMSAVFNEKSKGIVVTADAITLPAIIVQLRLLRRTNSTLPVEVFLLSRSDYDKYVCEKVLPHLNARCKILQAFMAATPLPRLPEQRQRRTIRANEAIHKYLAVFFSSFENNLVVDPATLILNKPDNLFTQEPYLSNKLVLWPDFWLSSVSPSMYEIQREDMPPPTDRTVDLGQFIISKSSHFSTLLLSIYYTYYGGMLYDDLLKQSNGGEAGSQAIRAASFFVEESSYMIEHRVKAVGYFDKADRNAFHGVGMLQSLPSRVNESVLPLFLRSTNPFINPATIMKQNVTHFQNNSTVSEVHKLWGGKDGLQVSNQWQKQEAEVALWDEIKQVACIDSILMTTAWSTDDDRLMQCNQIKEYMKRMSYYL